MSPYRGEFSVRWQSTTNRPGPGRHPGAAFVAKAIGRWIRCVPGGPIGRPFGQCRSKVRRKVTTQVVARSPDRRPESVMVSEFGVRVTARPKESFDMTSADRFEGVGGPCHA